MNSNTKIIGQIKKFYFQIQKKIWIFQNIGVLSIFFLFLGFVFGNLFGTFLDFFRIFLNWDGLIMTLTICFIEFINFLNYNKKQNLYLKKNLLSKINFLFFNKQKEDFNLLIQSPSTSQNYVSSLDLRFLNLKKTLTNEQKVFLKSKRTLEKQKFKKKFLFIKILNFYKIGLILGLFIDAFKVGS
uniref:Hypothetical chloroplast RF20 n=1 Tax=Gloeotilopsis planctonica TaxID=34157 RepID=A0A1B2RZ99_9CHLO|nr:hypothetical chloroplast RF20 [Gloeotilopsis planctonica]